MWNDTYFEQHYFSLCKISKKIELSSSVHATGAFLNWYVSGELPTAQRDNWVDIWLGVVYGMQLPNTDKTLISPDVWADESVTRTLNLPTSTTRLTNFSYLCDEVKNLNRTEPEKWYAILFDILESTEKDEFTAAQKQHVVNYMGYLALHLLTVSIEDTVSISFNILVNILPSFNRFFCSYRYNGPSLPIFHTPFPPHSMALENVRSTFRRYSPQSQRCLAALVYSHAKAPTEHKDLVQNILSEGCLLALGFVGAECYSWTEKAAKPLQTSIYRLMDCMHRDPWNATTVSLIRHLRPENGDPKIQPYSWPWSGAFAIDASVLPRMGPNEEYIATMVAITVNCNADHPIWKLLQFNNLGQWQKERAIQSAEKIVRQHRSENPLVDEYFVKLERYREEGYC